MLTRLARELILRILALDPCIAERIGATNRAWRQLHAGLETLGRQVKTANYGLTGAVVTLAHSTAADLTLPLPSMQMQITYGGPFRLYTRLHTRDVTVVDAFERSGWCNIGDQEHFTVRLQLDRRPGDGELSALQVALDGWNLENCSIGLSREDHTTGWAGFVTMTHTSHFSAGWGGQHDYPIDYPILNQRMLATSPHAKPNYMSVHAEYSWQGADPEIY
jgi:hypothetical protein